MAVMIGIDLCDGDTSVCVFGGSGVTMIPTVVCRAKDTETWLIGEEGYRRALSAGGVLTDKLISLLGKNGTSTIYKRTYSAVELLTAFFGCVLKLLETEPAAVDSFTISLHNTKREIMDGVREAAVAAGLREEAVHLIGHAEAFIYYTLQQDKELYSNEVELFDLSEDHLSCYALKVVRGIGRNSVIAEGEEMEEAFQLGVLKTDSGRKLADRIMTGCAKRRMERKIISSVFLTGRGFETTEWAETFKAYICRRRRVLCEQGIFARGAAVHAANACGEAPEIPYLMFCDTRTDFELSLPVVINNRQSQLILVGAGESWYNYSAQVEVIPYGEDAIELELSPMDKFAAKKKLRLPLETLPKRPEKCTRVALRVSLADAHRLQFELTDLGFGEFFPASKTVIRKEMEI